MHVGLYLIHFLVTSFVYISPSVSKTQYKTLIDYFGYISFAQIIAPTYLRLPWRHAFILDEKKLSCDLL